MNGRFLEIVSSRVLYKGVQWIWMVLGRLGGSPGK